MEHHHSSHPSFPNTPTLEGTPHARNRLQGNGHFRQLLPGPRYPDYGSAPTHGTLRSRHRPDYCQRASYSGCPCGFFQKGYTSVATGTLFCWLTALGPLASTRGHPLLPALPASHPLLRTSAQPMRKFPRAPWGHARATTAPRSVPPLSTSPRTVTASGWSTVFAPEECLRTVPCPLWDRSGPSLRT